ncbi:MAG: putative secreted protein [Myxococcales bacterium]|nr:putative secreted protein [Myxococcales bacterium]
MSKSSTYSRRRFLRDIGVSAAAVPFVVGLDSLYAHAQVPLIPKRRLIVIYTPNGMLYSNWRIPQSAPEIDISTGKVLTDPANVLTPLNENAARLLVLDRVSSIGARQMYQTAATAPDKINHPGGHQKGLGNLLTGQVLLGGVSTNEDAGLANGISIDRVLANSIFNGKSKFPTLEIGVQTDETTTNRYVDKRLSYDGPRMPRAPQNDPFVLFKNVFGSGTAGSNNQRADMDKSVLDAVLSDFARLKTKVSSGDSQLLDQHATSVRSIETQLATVVNCGSVTTPSATSTGAIDLTNPVATHAWAMLRDNFQDVARLQMSIMVQAIACGLTNVVTFMFANSETDMQFPWLNVLKGHHGMSHARDADLVKVDQYYAGQVNGLINALKAIPDSGAAGSLMDNSLILYANCLSDGASHHSDNMMLTLAGSNGGYFRQGKLIRYNNTFTADAVKDQNTIGTPDHSNSDLMVSIMNSFESAAGKPLSTTFGDPRFCTGPLPSIKA